jgi:hypothetical protein
MGDDEEIFVVVSDAMMMSTETMSRSSRSSRRDSGSKVSKRTFWRNGGPSSRLLRPRAAKRRLLHGAPGQSRDSRAVRRGRRRTSADRPKIASVQVFRITKRKLERLPGRFKSSRPDSRKMVVGRRPFA